MLNSKNEDVKNSVLVTWMNCANVFHQKTYDEEFYLVECPRVQGVNAIGETETYLDENDEEGTNKR